MEQRRCVRPPNWSELAERLAAETDGAVVVKGEMLRKWLLAAEDIRDRAMEPTREGARPW